MKHTCHLFLLTFISIISSYGQGSVNDAHHRKVFYASDSINFKKVKDNIYEDRSGKVYIKTAYSRPLENDSSVLVYYYRDESDFLDLKTYQKIGDGYFKNKNKVYIWFATSDGEYPNEITGADAKTFKPFKGVAGGTDKEHVFYMDHSNGFAILKDANPKTVKALNPKKGCWNCGDCYFVDDKSVYFGFDKIKGADPVTFKLTDQIDADAEDRNGKYFDGELIN